MSFKSVISACRFVLTRWAIWLMLLLIDLQYFSICKLRSGPGSETLWTHGSVRLETRVDSIPLDVCKGYLFTDAILSVLFPSHGVSLGFTDNVLSLIVGQKSGVDSHQTTHYT